MIKSFLLFWRDDSLFSHPTVQSLMQKEVLISVETCTRLLGVSRLIHHLPLQLFIPLTLFNARRGRRKKKCVWAAEGAWVPVTPGYVSWRSLQGLQLIYLSKLRAGAPCKSRSVNYGRRKEAHWHCCCIYLHMKGYLGSWQTRMAIGPPEDPINTAVISVCNK